MFHDAFKLPPKNVSLWVKMKRLWATEKIQESAGAVVFFIDQKKPVYLLIERGNPYHDWVFPKGVVEEGENPEQAALLEIYEETGLKVKIVHKLTLSFYKFYWDLTNYKFHKTVHYFLAEASSNKANFDHIPRGDEESKTFKQIKWFSLEEAINTVKHPQEKQLLREADEIVTQ